MTSSLWVWWGMSSQDRYGPATANQHPAMLSGHYAALSNWYGRVRAAGVDSLMLHLPHGAEFPRSANGDVMRYPDGSWIRGNYTLAARVKRRREGLDHLTRDYEFAQGVRDFRRIAGVRRIGIYVGAIAGEYLALSPEERAEAIRPYQYAEPDFLVVDGAGQYVEGTPEHDALLALDEQMGGKVCGVEPRPDARCVDLAARPSFTLTATLDHAGGFSWPGWVPTPELTGERVIIDNSSRSPAERLVRARACAAAGFGISLGLDDLAETAAMRAALVVAPAPDVPAVAVEQGVSA